jgi:hypothetical protein
MKTKTLLAGIFLSIITASGQSGNFSRAMIENLEKAKSSVTLSDYQILANSFARIAEAEKTEWTPWYYAAFYNLVINFEDTDRERKEKYISLAQKQIESGMKLKPDETEFYVLKVMSYYAEMAIDPMKGMTLMSEVNALLNEAKTINPDNPRIYLEEAEAIYNMPPEFGGGKEKAMPIFLVAKEKFVNFTPATPLAPSWGEDRCDMLIEGKENNK